MSPKGRRLGDHDMMGGGLSAQAIGSLAQERSGPSSQTQEHSNQKPTSSGSKKKDMFDKANDLDDLKASKDKKK